MDGEADEQPAAKRARTNDVPAQITPATPNTEVMDARPDYVRIGSRSAAPCSEGGALVSWIVTLVSHALLPQDRGHVGP